MWKRTGISSCGVLEPAAELLLPTAAPLLQSTAQDHIPAWRQFQSQTKQPVPAAQRQKIPARRQKPEIQRPAGVQPAGRPGASPLMERHTVKGLPVGHLNTDTAQFSGVGTQGYAGLLILAQAKGAAGQQRGIRPSYCSSLALTTYCPAITPPKRYFPSVLVLVVATSVSVVTPRAVTT